MLDDDSRSGGSTFEIDFVLNSTIYNYGFRYTESTFLEEWLVDQTRKPRTLFRRRSEGQSVTVDFPGRNLGGTSEESRLLDLIRLQTRANSLFLSAAAQGNHEFLSAIFKWIEERFNLLRPREVFNRSYTARTCKTPEQKARVKALLAAADTGIVDFQIAEESPPEEVKRVIAAVKKVIESSAPGGDASIEFSPTAELPREQITMLHRGSEGKGYSLPFDDESSGTRAYFYMLGPILQELEEGSILLIDELESSLHPRLARILVQLFNDPDVNPKGAQLIFATHALSLLDLDLLRRDQFWITERDAGGSTVLTSLSEFRPRKGQNVGMAYLHGRFGGVPFLDEELIRSAFSPTTDDPLGPEHSGEIQ